MINDYFRCTVLVRLLLKNWHLSVFSYKIAYNTRVFAVKSIATARGGTGGRARTAQA